MNICTSFLKASRTVAKKDGRETDKDCAVFDHGGDHYEVRHSDDSIMWSGKAHCKWCARVEAIASPRKRS